MAKTRVPLVATGGIGTMSAFGFESGGLVEVTAVMRSNYNAAVKDGINLDSVQWGQVKGWRPTTISKVVPDVSKGDVLPFDLIVVLTKNIPDMSPIVPDIIAPAVTPGKSAIVLSQNGLDIEKRLSTRFPTNPLISSVAYTGATETRPAKIYNDDPEFQNIGAFSNPQVPQEIVVEAARRFVAIYNPTVGWRNIAYNGTFDPLASILTMDTPRMRMIKYIVDDLILPAVVEIRSIAQADGLVLQEDLIDSIMHQDLNDTAFKPSMCQDFEKGNLMEVENLIGQPVREAKRLGVPAPSLTIIYGIMKGLQLKAKAPKGLCKAEFEPGSPYT